jgi:CBS domain-containing protein
VSDDFFSSLSNWWKTSWQAGVNAPSVGPKVGRGIFSGTITERGRELAELKHLHTQLSDAFGASPFADPEFRDLQIHKTFGEVFDRCDIEPTRDLLGALYDPIASLLEAEFFSFPDVRDEDWAYFDLKTRSELRKALLLRERLLGDMDYRLDLGRRVIGAITAGILRDIASDGFDDTQTLADGTSPLVFTTSLIDLAHDASNAVESTFGTLLNDDEIIRADLFRSLREQLARNLFRASGISENDPSPTKRFINPAQARDKSPPVLIETYLAGTPFQDLFEAPLPNAIPDKLRTEHALIVGGSGHGKSQLLLKFIHHDLTSDDETPPGIIVIDSQGDLIHTISRLALFDPDAANSLSERLILIDPDDVEFPVALNLFAFDHERMDALSRADRERILHSVIDLYEYFFSALLGAELTQKQGVVFRYLARLMLAIPGATIQTLRALMEDGRPYKPYMESLDGSARRFFATEFFSPGFRATKQQILRRLWGVLANPVFERMFSHPENRIDLFEAMNAGKIILINTAKDLLKAENCSIFGRFFIARIAQAALERATLPEEERRTTFVYIDEAHDYFDETLEQLFNQARKYGVGLHVAVQHLEQMPTRLRSTVMASTSLKFAGGVSAKDARALSDDMQSDADFISGMRKRRGRSEFAAFIKNRTAHALRINVELGAINSQPMMADNAYQSLIDANRESYCATLDEIEAMISGEGTQAPTPTDPIPPPPKQPEQLKTDAPDQPPPEDKPASKPSQTQHEPQPKSPSSDRQRNISEKDRHKEIDTYVAGVGGRQHTKLQQLVRNLAQERGFKATIEKQVPDGKGRIDVALEHDDLKIAVEISVSTDAAHETGNIKKGFEAGFDEVVLIIPDTTRRAALTQAIKNALEADQKSRFAVLSVEEFRAYLDERAAKLSSTETTVRGYRVTTKYHSVSPDEANNKRDAITKVIASTLIYNDECCGSE